MLDIEDIQRKIMRKLKKLRQAHEISDFTSVLSDKCCQLRSFSYNGQISRNMALNGHFIMIKFPHFGDKVLKLVSPLFVGVYLPEDSWMVPRNSLP